MGVVYEAEQVSLGRRVALKVLPGQASRRPDWSRSGSAARPSAAARLHHTNIVPVFEVGQDGDVGYYAMQFIHGQGLDAGHRRAVPAPRPRQVPAQGQSRRAGTIVKPRGDRSRPGMGIATLGEGVEVGSVLHSILTRSVRPGQPLQGAHRRTAPHGSGCSRGRRNGGGNQVRFRRSRIPIHAQARRDRECDCGRTQRLRTGASGRNHACPGRLRPFQVELDDPARRCPALVGRIGPTARSYRSLAQIGRQVAGGLAYAHARGIVHRDIKPSNLLLDTEGVVWIADFGLAKGEDEGLTHTGDILGTLRYMAPERFRGEGDARADIYALGLTLYELLTLSPGFDSTDRLKLIERIKSEEPTRPRSIDARIPRDLETIVLKAIEKDPKARYQSAEAMGEDLRRFLADEPIRARQVSAVERYWRWARRNPVIAVMGGVLTAVLIVTTIGSLLAAGRFANLAERAGQSAAAERSARLEADQAPARRPRTPNRK